MPSNSTIQPLIAAATAALAFYEASRGHHEIEFGDGRTRRFGAPAASRPVADHAGPLGGSTAVVGRGARPGTRCAPSRIRRARAPGQVAEAPALSHGAAQRARVAGRALGRSRDVRVRGSRDPRRRAPGRRPRTRVRTCPCRGIAGSRRRGSPARARRTCACRALRRLELPRASAGRSATSSSRPAIRPLPCSRSRACPRRSTRSASASRAGTRFSRTWSRRSCAVGRLDDAEAVLGQLEQQAAALDHRWATPAALRCRALFCSPDERADEAAAAAEQAAAAFAELGFPLDRARALLAAGAARRRAGQRRQAADSLSAAIEILDELGAPLWLERAEDELRRASPRPRRDRELTSAERRSRRSSRRA